MIQECTGVQGGGGGGYYREQCYVCMHVALQRCVLLLGVWVPLSVSALGTLSGRLERFHCMLCQGGQLGHERGRGE